MTLEYLNQNPTLENLIKFELQLQDASDFLVAITGDRLSNFDIRMNYNDKVKKLWEKYFWKTIC